MTVTTQPDPIRLNYNDKGKVLVTPEDHDLFLLTREAAAAACKAAHEQSAFFDQLEEILLPKLAHWITAHDRDVHRAFVTAREGGLLFLVVRKAVRYDADFTDALTALDSEIACDPELDLIRLDVLALPRVPDESAASFFAPGPAMVFTRAG